MSLLDSTSRAHSYQIPLQFSTQGLSRWLSTSVSLSIFSRSTTVGAKCSFPGSIWDPTEPWGSCWEWSGASHQNPRHSFFCGCHEFALLLDAVPHQKICHIAIGEAFLLVLCSFWFFGPSPLGIIGESLGTSSTLWGTGIGEDWMASTD